MDKSNSIANKLYVDSDEKLLITKFKKEFIHKNDIGNEYFYGDRFKMVNIIYDIFHRKEI